MTTAASTAVVVYDPGLVDPEHVALAGFVGGYRGLTRDAYTHSAQIFSEHGTSSEAELLELYDGLGRSIKRRVGSRVEIGTLRRPCRFRQLRRAARHH